MDETTQTPASSTAVTEASGHLGRLVIEALLARNVPANRIVAVVRDPQKVADFAACGVEVRRADYAQRYSRDAALNGKDGLSATSRADYTAAAAAVLSESGHENKICELGEDTAFTLSELAAEISKQANREIIYRDLPVEQFAQALIGAGLPEPLAQSLADADLDIERGDLLVESGDLSRLAGRPTTSLEEAVASALKK